MSIKDGIDALQPIVPRIARTAQPWENLMRTLSILIALLACTAISLPAQGRFDAYGNLVSSGPQLPGVSFPTVDAASVNGAAAFQAAWLPMGAGPGVPGEMMQAETLNGDLYIMYDVTGPNGNISRMVARWDGQQWVDVGSPSWNGRGVLFTAYKGRLYCHGAMADRVVRMYRYDGNVWEPIQITSRMGFSMFEGLEYQGQMYVGGNFADLSGVPNTNNIARWDGQQWSAVGEGLSNRESLGGADTNNTQVVSLAEYRGKLYAGGRFSHAGGLRTPYLAVWNGTSWEAGPAGITAPVEEMWSDNGLLYLYISYRGSTWPGILYTWDGTTLHQLSTHPLDWIADLRTFHGTLYVCGKLNNQAAIARWNGSEWETYKGFDPYFNPNTPHDTMGRAGFMFEHDGSLIVGGRIPGVQGVSIGNIARMCNDGECGAIAGSVYLDNNDDCARDDKDSGLPRRVVKMEPGPVFATTDADGAYMIPVLPGSYTVSAVAALHWNQTCPAAGGTHSATVTTANEHLTNLDFALKPVPNVRDVRVSITATRARPGRPVEYVIRYENVGTEPVNGTLTFTYDPRLSVVSDNPVHDRAGTASLEWDFSNLLVDESRTIHVVLGVPTTMSPGEVLCAYVTVDLQDMPDLVFNDDDRDSICVEVVASCDPNDITVHPLGIEADGTILPTDTVLAYTIRFQNTGNDTAFRVVVVDSLSASLDPETVRPGASSHQYSLNIGGNGVLTWTFQNIMLPDSGASEPGSHGVLKYFVKLRPRLPAGTVIANRAHIYFDYNAPVTTNTVTSVIAAPLGVQHSANTAGRLLVPNPTTGVLRVDVPMVAGATIAVLDVHGRRVMTTLATERSGQMLDMAGLASGTYLVVLPVIGGTVVQQVLLVR